MAAKKKAAKKKVGAKTSAKKSAAPAAAKKAKALSPAASDAAAKLRAAIWKNPADLDARRVYADWLLEQGSSQGEYMQLSLLENPTDDQSDRAQAIKKKDRGQWLGAARPFVRTWYEDSYGLVSHVVTEAPNFIEGFDRLLDLGPRLRIEVTSLRKKTRETVGKIATLALARVHHLDLGSNALDDKSLEMLAPAMKGVRRLSIGENDYTGKGLRALGAQVDVLQFLCISPSIGSTADPEDLAAAILETPGFRSLLYLHLYRGKKPSDATIAKLKAMPGMRRVSVSTYPSNSEDVLSEEELSRTD